MPRPVRTRFLLLRAVLPFVALPVADDVAAAGRVDTLRVLVVLPAGGATAAAASDGVALGAEESARTAALFGVTVEVVAEHAPTPGETRAAAERALTRRVQALIGGTDDAECRALEALAVERRIAFLALGCADGGAAPVDRCERFAFFLRPSTTTARRAIAARASQPADSTAAVELWHPSLFRFGAAQLNERFRRRFGREMTSEAWAGWMAMKIVTDAALRGRATQPGGLARYLLRRATRFDGHKGEPLTFDAATGELRQPLYVVVDGRRASAEGATVLDVPTETAFGERAAGEAPPSSCGGAAPGAGP